MVISSIGRRSILGLLLVLLTPMAWGMRCGTDLISIRALDYEVYHKCGKPDFVRTLGYTITHKRLREYEVERWIYEKPNDTIYVLEFIGGELTRIDWRRSPK